MLNSDCESGDPCLDADFRGKVFSLSPEYDVSCEIFINAFYHIEDIPSSPSFLSVRFCKFTFSVGFEIMWYFSSFYY